MDPNETLRLFRERYANYSALSDRREATEEEGGLGAREDLDLEILDELEYAAGHAHDLFEWLATGGYAPDWTVTNV
jgi:hypothetical protein